MSNNDNRPAELKDGTRIVDLTFDQVFLKEDGTNYERNDDFDHLDQINNPRDEYCLCEAKQRATDIYEREPSDDKRVERNV